MNIDFGNGEGYKPITLGNPFTISYSDTGYYNWTSRITDLGVNYYAQSRIHLTGGNSSALNNFKFRWEIFRNQITGQSLSNKKIRES